MRRFDNVLELWAGKPTYKHVLLRWNYFYDFGFCKRNGAVIIRFMKVELDIGWS